MIFFFSGTLILASVFQISFNMFFAEIFYISQVEQQLREMYTDISSNFESNTSFLYNKISRYEDELNLRLLIFDENENVIYQTLANQVDPTLLQYYSIIDGEIVSNFEDEPLTNIVNSYRNNSQTIAIRGSFIAKTGVEYFVVLETPLATIQEAVSTLNAYSIYISTVAVSVGALIIYYFATRLSRPITEINSVAKAVSKMDFSQKAIVYSTNSEIDQLANNINSMSSNLEKMIFDLKIANIELKKDNDLRKQVDDMRREFVANVSHELKTPLSLLQGYAEILKSDMQGIDKDFYLEVIIDESRHMNELVNRLLNITSLENGLTKLNYEKFDLSSLVDWTLSKNEILSDNIKITSKLLDSAYVFADKLFIEQAITNYLSNALTYAENEVIIELSEDNGYYKISVTNDGMPIENPDRIWHSFFREDKARTRTKDKNFGLGLYIVKTIITSHEGKYGVFNNDNGVTFYFELEKNNDNIDDLRIENRSD